MRHNRKLKLQLWKENPHCHWCGRLTQVTNIRNGVLPEDAATVDHLFSRYNVKRWLHHRHDEPTKVLSCYKCNHDRGNKETSLLSREERSKRGKGMTLVPKRKFNSIGEIIQYLKEEKGIDIPQSCDTV